MTHLRPLRIKSILKCISSTPAGNYLISSIPSFWPSGSLGFVHYPRFHGSRRAFQSENLELFESTSAEYSGRICPAARKAAQAALLDYLYCTRLLQFTDAEYMSKNSPQFLKKLLNEVHNEPDVEKAVSRFLRYHPINEFEPFFESLGLKPREFAPFLPRNLMFLSDDELLVQNYHVFCNNGIARNKIGKIYKEATEVFQYGYGVLESKIKAYEELGLSHSAVAKAIVCSPYLLIGDVNGGFVKLLEKFESLGLEFSWIVGHLSESNSYNWSHMLDVLCLLDNFGFGEGQLVGLIRQHPGILLEGAGTKMFSIIGFFLKFGYTMSQIRSTLVQLPQVDFGKFLSNLMQYVMFFNEIEMDAVEIGKIVRSHSILFGSCALKKTPNLLKDLKINKKSKKQLRKVIQKNPHEMKKLVLGSEVELLASFDELAGSHIPKTKFLLGLGFVKNSRKMNKAFTLIRGKDVELQERFDCIVEAGFDRKDAVKMVTIAPQVLNQSKYLIKSKIDFLVNDLGYPISTLNMFTSFLSYSSRRIKLRLLMYNWLKDEGAAAPDLTLRTIISSSDKRFIDLYVNNHPDGPRVWQDLKKRIYSA